ncbi:MAG: Arm DNA-binding domain-containing protein, partial [Lentilitoribacter sp.]
SKIKNLKPKEKAYKTADFDGLFVLVNPNGSKLFDLSTGLTAKRSCCHLESTLISLCCRRGKCVMMQGAC